jgi:diadenosine tetraphosphatase ApaH/serine/threonine PP2A family protein phosphatase
MLEPFPRASTWNSEEPSCPRYGVDLPTASGPDRTGSRKKERYKTDRSVGSVRAVNLGSVSNSSRVDKSATYAIIHDDGATYRIEHRVVDYDHSTVLRALEEVAHPATILRKFFVNP